MVNAPRKRQVETPRLGQDLVNGEQKLQIPISPWILQAKAQKYLSWKRTRKNRKVAQLQTGAHELGADITNPH
jgi:hypothetical protein